MMGIDSLLLRLNRSRIWTCKLGAWDMRLSAATFDRWLYLVLHRMGLMGREDRAFFRSKVQKGMHVADVGANIGLYTCELATIVGAEGKVYSFEPDPYLFKMLEANVRLNGFQNVELFPFGAGSENAQAMLQQSCFNSGDNRVAVNGKGANGVNVELRRLDDLLPGVRLDFVKIDVQGWEMNALKGMKSLLTANHGVKVCFEYSPDALVAANSSGEELISFLKDLKFTIRECRDSGKETTPTPHVGWSGYINLIAERAS